MPVPGTGAFPTECRAYLHAPDDCPFPVFDSADGSIRCRGCHLHPDQCTCGPTVSDRLRRMLALDLLITRGTHSPPSESL